MRHTNIAVDHDTGLMSISKEVDESVTLALVFDMEEIPYDEAMFEFAEAYECVLRGDAIGTIPPEDE